MRSSTTLIPLLVLAASTPVFAGETFDVHVLNFCDGLDCGEHEDVLRAFEGVNRAWSVAGISFRPTIEDIANDVYFDIDDKTDPAINELLAIAQAHPERITYFVGKGKNPTCWASMPQHQAAGSPKAYTLFCYSMMGGVAFAHELGHFFCLGHTFTFQDDATHNPVDRDGDNLADTPEDPGVRETTLAVDPDNTPGHEWCEMEVLDPQGGDDVPAVFEIPAGPGFAITTGCAAKCAELDSNNTEVATSFAPLGENGMSYYGNCAGPYVLDGERREFFSADQVERIATCRENEPERAALVNVCAGDDDTDHDGICDDDDACPERASLRGQGTDADGDGIVDGCDACPGVAGEQPDTDGDGFCDEIDVDDDNDGCRDYQDKHPLERMLATGYVVAAGSNCDNRTIYTFEGLHGDFTGQRLCEISSSNSDMDGDGILDDDDLCPITFGEVACIESVSCPLIPIDWRFTCLAGACNEIELVRVSSINPPDVYKNIQIVNDAIYIVAEHNRTVAEIARSLAPGPAEHVTLELRARDPAASSAAAHSAAARSAAGETAPGGRARTVHVASYDEASFAPADRRTRGTAVMLSPPLVQGEVVRTEMTWGVGLAAGAPLADLDADGIPDMNDNCTARRNIDQHDADRDGFGDVCDADLDNDGSVDPDDLLRIVRALGTRALDEYVAPPKQTVAAAAPDGIEVDHFDVTSWGLRDARTYRAAADLDANRVVDFFDVRQGAQSLFAAPGPSGLASSEGPCVPRRPHGQTPARSSQRLCPP